MRPRLACLALVVALTAPAAVAPSPARAADDATAQARSHYEVGLQLFDAREHEQALIEFTRANELKSRPAALFMMAQCEYLLGRLKDARAHYARYVSENPTGEFVELAKDRIESIDKRPSTLVINTVPDDVTVRIRTEPATTDGAGPPATDVSGQAPNNFQVPRGHYRIDVIKKNYQGQTRLVDLDVAETKPLFFKLDPIPARLEITTTPGGATLYVNGNRARNPYAQDVPPGRYEIFAEAAQHDSRTIDLQLSPGETRRLVGPDALLLPYVRRSGRPEIIVASGVIGAFIGAGAVAAAVGKPFENPGVASVFLVTGAGLAGAVGGALIAAPIVPRYIPDNRALYVIGGMWMGGAEGAGIGIVARQIATHEDKATPPCTGPGDCRTPLGVQLRAAFFGSVPGLALGLTVGGLTADRAPTYGRAALIQSAALGGLFAGALGQLALQWKPYGAGWEETTRVAMTDAATAKSQPCATGSICAFRETSVMDLAPGALIGLNLGLAAGLMSAYLPDQTKYGPSWRRVLIVDLAVGTSMLAGGIAGCVANTDHCLLGQTNDQARAIVGASALAGGAVGLAAGILLTRHFDDEPTAAVPPSPITLAPTVTKDGAGFVALGSF